LGWPSAARETKPWTRWWWHGSALTKEGITSEMEAYHRAGIGGLEITPIYGVYGQEDEFVDYLSPQWMDLFHHVLNEAERLDIGIDMATGTGWPFGGPWVTNQDACKNIRFKTFEVKGGSQLKEKIEFIQPPYLRLVGNQIYEVTEKADAEGRRLMGSRKEPALLNSASIRITDLVEPVNENKNLQALAIDQVQFEKSLPLKLLMGYSENEKPLDLTAKVDAKGTLSWTAPPGTWTLYAVFEGLHGKMVERAGPGGEGNVIDHFSAQALKNYLQPFDKALPARSSLRAFFNDSYEVDDARGSADFTPTLFDEFLKRRGYDLSDELPALFGKDAREKNQRVLCDYRETISELLLDNFTTPWKEWAHKKGALVRNQAHGSPANILDLYAVVDIPEIEGTEPLRTKMATSSGHVNGKKLISAEAATWLNEHFESNLADIKRALDNFMLHGVNHIVYHGTTYSPPDEPWPGRLFYAAVHLNPRNPLWNDFDALNTYVTRCQSFLQNTFPDNDVLLYYPIYDRFSSPGPEFIEHFDGIGKTFSGSAFEKCAEEMLRKGYAFDFISDRQIEATTFTNGSFTTKGNSAYRSLVIPSCSYIPLKTMEKILQFAESGGKVIFIERMPEAVSGFHNVKENTQKLNKIKQRLVSLKASVRTGSDLSVLLDNAGVERNTMTDNGVHILRKKNATGAFVYFIRNMNSHAYEGWLPMRNADGAVLIFDPMTGDFGKAKVRKGRSGMQVHVVLHPEESLILEQHAHDAVDAVDDFTFSGSPGEPVQLSGKWKVSFESGGPTLPPSYTSDSLTYWTTLNDPAYHAFSGTALYELTFDNPDNQIKQWVLRLDSVKESAEVILNNKSIGKVIGPMFQLSFDGALLRQENTLQIRVSNLMANRIAYMDRNNIFWKRFYNVNFPARKRENVKNNLFDASNWTPKPSGLAGRCVLIPLKNIK
jgi:hypothetical protein